MPGQKKNQVKSRIIITPQHAKLSNALDANIRKFEESFGSIKNYDNPKYI